MAKNWTRILTGLLMITAAGGAEAQHDAAGASGGPVKRLEHLYYNVSDGPQTLMLLALSDSREARDKVTMDVTDVSWAPKLLLGNTWRIDCAGERMEVIHTTRLQLGSPVTRNT